jgi:RNA binding exosome subunit
MQFNDISYQIQMAAVKYEGKYNSSCKLHIISPRLQRRNIEFFFKSLTEGIQDDD